MESELAIVRTQSRLFFVQILCRATSITPPNDNIIGPAT